MKILRNLPLYALPLVGASSVLLTSCGALDTINQPINESGFNPLDPAGSTSGSSASSDSSNPMVNTNGHGFEDGDMVEVVIPNTALFDKVPKSGDRYKKVLNVGDSLKVIGGKNDFIKVVTESGETGYVSSVMVVSQGSLTSSSPAAKPKVSSASTYEKPIVPDVAPEPVVQGIGSPDEIPSVEPEEVPSISAPVPVEPDPGLSVPGLPVEPSQIDTPESIDTDPAALVPDPTPEPSALVPDPTPDTSPLVPSLPDGPAPEPVSPGLPD